MNLIALFPGLGSQYVGMGKDLFENYTQVRESYRQASKIVGSDIAKISFDGPREELDKLTNAEVAILVHSLATFELLKRAGMRPKAVAGHSLGEYSALAAAQVISFEDAIKLVYRRARLIEEFAQSVKGTMIAIIGLGAKSVHQLCLECRNAGIIEIVNYNSPFQFVASGETKALTKLKNLAASVRGCFALELPIQYPLHSSLMLPLRKALSEQLGKIRFANARVPIVTNLWGKPERSKTALKRMLVTQLTGPVFWEQAVRNIIAGGKGTVFIEVGPKKLLRGLIRRICAEAKVFNVSDSQSMKGTMKELTEMNAFYRGSKSSDGAMLYQANQQQVKMGLR